jgi:hypothetical protein
VRHRHDGRNVLNFERQRAGGFGEHHLRIRPEIALDRRARERIVIADFDAEARQVMVTKPARRRVDGIRDEQVVAAREQSEQRERRRGEA